MNRLYKYLSYVIFIVVGAIAWSLIPKCSDNRAEPEEIKNALKSKIKQEIKAGDSLKKVEVKSDSVRIVYKIKWLKAKSDTGKIPCDSALKKIVHVCDTLILVDSVETANLKKVILNDSLIISDQFKVIKSDSIEISGLNKSIRKHKRQKKLLAGGLGVLLLISVFK